MPPSWSCGCCNPAAHAAPASCNQQATAATHLAAAVLLNEAVITALPLLALQAPEGAAAAAATAASCPASASANVQLEASRVHAGGYP